MKTQIRCLCAMAVIGVGMMLAVRGPHASADHFVITNNSNISGQNSGTVFSLSGNRANLMLHEKENFNTGVTMVSGGTAGVVMISHGADVCLFLANPQDAGNEITAFTYPGYTLVGNYNDPSIMNSGIGISVSARGNFLFIGSGNNTLFTGDLAVWRIRSGCTLELLSTFSTQYPIVSLAATPNGQTVVVTYNTENGLVNGVDSFSVSSSGELTEHGPYGVDGANLVMGVDITADGEYALFAVTGFYPSSMTEVGIFTINSDGSLGEQRDWGGGGSLGPGTGTQSIRLSPDERFVFVNDDNSGANITTLNFDEGARYVSWTGCITTVRAPKGENLVDGGWLATAFPTGSGGGLYLAEDYNFASIGVLAIDPTTGCTTEVPQSPFLTGNKDLDSLAPWPSRPF
jgi:hypothetical protein